MSKQKGDADMWFELYVHYKELNKVLKKENAELKICCENMSPQPCVSPYNSNIKRVLSKQNNNIISLEPETEGSPSYNIIRSYKKNNSGRGSRRRRSRRRRSGKRKTKGRK
jgi:hypothetical protein